MKDLLRKVQGLKWRSEVEFEEQCELRGIEYKGLWTLVDGRIKVTEGAEIQKDGIFYPTAEIARKAYSGK